jgi:hypothetical protein
MKKFILALFIGFVASTGAFASENQTSATPDLFADHDHHGIWHCTAYPGHGGHHHYGFSARDEHRHHAYSKAIRRCERATGRHCHHVDCHKDHK